MGAPADPEPRPDGPPAGPCWLARVVTGAPDVVGPWPGDVAGTDAWPGLVRVVTGALPATAPPGADVDAVACEALARVVTAAPCPPTAGAVEPAARDRLAVVRTEFATGPP